MRDRGADRATHGSAREAVLLATRVIRTVEATLPAELGKLNAFAALVLLGIDERGLDAGDRKLLETLEKSKKPLGLATLAAKAGIGAATILERHEPFLLRLGLVEVTPYGRRAC